MSSEFHFAIHQFIERKLTIEAFISNAGSLYMRSNFDNILIIVIKETLKAFDDFKRKQQKCMK